MFCTGISIKSQVPRVRMEPRGTCRNLLLVEAGGVEPPSENDPRKASTGLVREHSHLGPRPRTGGPRSARRNSSHAYRRAPTHASLMGLTPCRVIRRPPVRRDLLGGQVPELLTQRRRSRNRCWQLLLLPLFTRPAAPRPATPASPSPSKPLRPQRYAPVVRCGNVAPGLAPGES